MPWAAAAALAGAVYSADKASDSASDTRDAGLAAADLERQTATDTLAYYRERDAQSAELQAQANAIAGRVANSQVALMDQQRQISGEYHDRNKSVFWPLENGMVADAQAYDTPQKREEAAAKAIADVGLQAGIARESQARSLARMGVNPNSGKTLAMGNQMSMAEASAKAAAGGLARNQVDTQGWARRMDAASLGRNLPSAQATAAGTAISAGNGAVSAAYAPVSAANAATQVMGQGLTGYTNQMSNAGRLALGSMDNDRGWGSLSAQMFGIGGSLAGQAFANQGTNQSANLAYANGVSSQGGDGMGAFISSNGW
jgi:hypothetical protein